MYQKGINLINRQKKINTAYLRMSPLIIYNIPVWRYFKYLLIFESPQNTFIMLNSAQGTISRWSIFYFIILFLFFISSSYLPHPTPPSRPLLTWADSENPGIKAVSPSRISQASCSLLWVCKPRTALLKFPVISSMIYWKQRVFSKLFI